MKRSPLRYLWSAQDIRRKLLVTIGLLTIYRLAAHVPVPGVNKAAIASILQGGGAGGTLFSLLDLLSGGTVSNFSVLAMGVYPYITAQIILQLSGAYHPSSTKTDGRRSSRRPKVDGEVDIYSCCPNGSPASCWSD